MCNTRPTTDLQPLKALLSGSEPSSGNGSQPSPSTSVSVKEVPIRIDVYRSPEIGLTDSLELRATTCVSSEGSTDAPTVTLSLRLPTHLAQLLAGASPEHGVVGEITYVLSFPISE